MAEDVRQVRDEVAAAREDLADTVEALAYKVNAPRRYKDRVAGRISAIRTHVTPMTQIAKQRIAARLAHRRRANRPDTAGAETAAPAADEGAPPETCAPASTTA